MAGCGPAHGGDVVVVRLFASAAQEPMVTVVLTCLNCGFSFPVTYAAGRPTHDSTTVIACGHCRSTRWASQTS